MRVGRRGWYSGIQSFSVSACVRACSSVIISICVVFNLKGFDLSLSLSLIPPTLGGAEFHFGLSEFCVDSLQTFLRRLFVFAEFGFAVGEVLYRHPQVFFPQPSLVFEFREFPLEKEKPDDAEN